MDDRPARSRRLDRVEGPARRSDGPPRDEQGKEALYSTAPTAAPAAPVLVTCRRCGVQRGLGLLAAVRLLLPVAVVRPLARRVWTRCPACGRWSWLQCRAGGLLRSLLAGRPGRGRGQHR